MGAPSCLVPLAFGIAPGRISSYRKWMDRWTYILFAQQILLFPQSDAQLRNRGQTILELHVLLWLRQCVFCYVFFFF